MCYLIGKVGFKTYIPSPSDNKILFLKNKKEERLLDLFSTV
jgi:hypothetical protein